MILFSRTSDCEYHSQMVVLGQLHVRKTSFELLLLGGLEGQPPEVANLDNLTSNLGRLITTGGRHWCMPTLT